MPFSSYRLSLEEGGSLIGRQATIIIDLMDSQLV